MRSRVRRPGWLAAIAMAILWASPAPGLALPVSGFTAWRAAGDGTFCVALPCGDGGPATDAQLGTPFAVAVGPGGSVYVADPQTNVIRRISPEGTITTVAGSGATCPLGTNPCGDGGPATQAAIDTPLGLAVDPAGNLYFADSADQRVRRVDAANGRITTVAGSGALCPDGTKPCGDGGPATAASLHMPKAVALDAGGSLYIADSGDERVRRVGPDGTITAFAGTGAACKTAPACGDGGPATAGLLNEPVGLAVDGAGRLLIADRGDREVRIVGGGLIGRVAGDGTACVPPACGDGGPATSAQISAPLGLAVDGQGRTIVSDFGTNEVRRISAAGTISRIAGDGTQCTSAPACGDGGAATDARLAGPAGVALDSTGNVFVADALDHEVRWLAGPQAGPAGSRGSDGPTGPAGARGPAGRDGRLVLVAYQAAATARHVAVRYVLGDRAAVVLRVTGRHVRPAVVARQAGHAGLNLIRWNGRLHGRRVPPGRYRFSVTAVAGGRRATSSVSALVAAR